VIAAASVDAHARASMHRLDENRTAESAAAIRAKKPFWRATIRHQARNHKNFFIAKKHDSESTQSAFCWHRQVALSSIASR
jgi:hypothetical protein